MLSKLRIAAADCWQGLWQPTYPLHSKKRRWDYFEYWTFRARDVIVAILVFLVPPGLAFLIYERSATHPSAMLLFGAIISTLWLVTVLLAYARGRAVRQARMSNTE